MNMVINIKAYEFYHELRRLAVIDAIWLYGSRARGSNTEQSDIDIAIVCPRASAEDWQNIQNIINNADTLFKIDLVRFDTLHPKEQLYAHIMRDKKVLFERIPNNYPWYESFLDLTDALDQLEEMVNEPEYAKSYVRDATIQRFEFCVELFWKTLKKICIAEQFEVTSPKMVLQKSLELGLIQDAAIWHAMLDDRNMTSHTYKRSVANEIYYKVDAYYKYMRQAFITIKQKYSV